MSIRVGVFGAGGRMGIAVCNAVNADPDLTLAAAIDPSYGGLDVGEVTGVSGCSFEVAREHEALLHANVGVAVDFTQVDAARNNLAFCAEHGIHAVVGTSGFNEDDFADIAALFTRSNCLIAPNFAIGAVLMIRFAEMAAPYFDTAEIIELHHDTKIDAPSGTAISTAERMAKASSDWAVDPTTIESIESARGAKAAGDIAIHSIRMRGMTAHQEVLLGTTGQTLTLRHDSYERSSFMPGVILAVKRIGQVDGLTVGLDGMLEL